MVSRVSLCFCSSPLLSFKETCSLSKKNKTKREELSEKRIREEYEKLGAIRYGPAARRLSSRRERMARAARTEQPCARRALTLVPHNRESRHFEVLFPATVRLAQIPGGRPSPSLYSGLRCSRGEGAECHRQAAGGQRTRRGSSATLPRNSGKSAPAPPPRVAQDGPPQVRRPLAGSWGLHTVFESLRRHRTQT